MERTALRLVAFVAIFCVAALAAAIATGYANADGGRGIVTIQAANPYSFDVRLEVKCDWEWQRGRYRFHQFIVVPGKKSTMISVPNSLRFCEIWPKVIF